MIKLMLTEDQLLALEEFLNDKGSMNETMYEQLGRKLTILAAKHGLLDSEIDETYDDQTNDESDVPKTYGSNVVYTAYATKYDHGWTVEIWQGSEYIATSTTGKLADVDDLIRDYLRWSGVNYQDVVIEVVEQA